LSSASDVRDYLTKLPKGLREAYDGILEDIMNSDGQAPIIATKAFQWIMCSWRPITAEELVAAVCEDPHDRSVTEAKNDIDLDYILAACRNLIIRTKARDPKYKAGSNFRSNRVTVCQLSHLSVLEYLRQRQWTMGQAHTAVALTCMDRLLHPCEDDPRKPCACLVHKYSKLGPYLNGWFRHVKGAEDTTSEPSDQMKRLDKQLYVFLGDPESRRSKYALWLEHAIGKVAFHDYGEDRAAKISYASDACKKRAPDFSEPVELALYQEQFKYTDVEYRGQALHGVIALGLEKVPPEWQDFYFPVNKKSAELQAKIAKYRLLHLASTFGHDKIISRMLQQGADANQQATDIYGLEGTETPLMCAASKNELSAVRILVEQGKADVNIIGERGTALLLGVEKAHIAIVRYLLEKGADPNLFKDTYLTPLYSAANKESAELTRLLMRHGANPNLQCYYGSPLHYATHWSKVDVIRCLCGLDDEKDEEKGGKDQREDEGRTRNSEGWNWPGKSRKKEETNLDRQVIARCDVNAVNSRNETALMIAVEAPKLDTVKLLLDLGARTDIVGGKYGLALNSAVMLGHMDNIKTLLDHGGADINAMLPIPETESKSGLLQSIPTPGSGHWQVQKSGGTTQAGANEFFCALYTAFRSQSAWWTGYTTPVEKLDRSVRALEVMLFLIQRGAEPRTAEQFAYYEEKVPDLPQFRQVTQSLMDLLEKGGAEWESSWQSASEQERKERLEGIARGYIAFWDIEYGGRKGEWLPDGAQKA